MIEPYVIPLNEACLRLNTTRLNTLMQLKKGILDGVMHEGEWFVSESSLRSVLEAGTGGTACAAVRCACSGGCRRGDGA